MKSICLYISHAKIIQKFLFYCDIFFNDAYMLADYFLFFWFYFVTLSWFLKLLLYYLIIKYLQNNQVKTSDTHFYDWNYNTNNGGQLLN